MIIIDLQRKEDHNLLKDEKCMRCHEKFILNRFMVRHGLFYFHLTCFKKYLEDEIKDYQRAIEGNKNDMNELKPYEKEMICETLLKEKYG